MKTTPAELLCKRRRLKATIVERLRRPPTDAEAIAALRRVSTSRLADLARDIEATDER